jgi:hypothetical protein
MLENACANVNQTFFGMNIAENSTAHWKVWTFVVTSVFLTVFTLTFAVFRIRSGAHEQAVSSSAGGNTQVPQIAPTGIRASNGNLALSAQPATKPSPSLWNAIWRRVTTLRVERIVMEKPTRHIV